MQLLPELNTEAIVQSRATLRFVRGSATYNDEENDVLRAALQDLKAGRKYNQAELARALGFKQQTISKLLDSTRRTGNGMSREVANALARVLGFGNAEDLLLRKGVASALREAPSGKTWGNRDLAAAIAPRFGIATAAIQSVVGRFASPSYRTKPPKWWMARFFYEDEQLALERVDALVVIPPPESAKMLPAAEKKPRRRA